MPVPPSDWTPRQIDSHWQHDHFAIHEQLELMQADRFAHLEIRQLAARIARQFGKVQRYDLEVVFGGLHLMLWEHDGIKALTDGLWLPGIQPMPTTIRRRQISTTKPYFRPMCQRAWEKLVPALLKDPFSVPAVVHTADSPPAHARATPRLRPDSYAQAGIVYLILAEGTPRVKIGRSVSAQVRFHSLRTASPFPLRLLRSIPTGNCVALERRLHQRYAVYRQHGEWFDLPQEVLAQLLREDFGK